MTPDADQVRPEPPPVLGYAVPKTEAPEPQGHWTTFAATAWLVGLLVSFARAAWVSGDRLVSTDFARAAITPIAVGLVGVATAAASVAAGRRVLPSARLRPGSGRAAGILGAAHMVVGLAAVFTVGQAQVDRLSKLDLSILFACLAVVPLSAPLILLRAARVRG